MKAAPARMRTEFSRLFGDGLKLVRSGGAKLLALVIASQLVIIGIAQPVLAWLFRQALRAGGMHGLDVGNLQFTNGITLTLLLLVLIIALAFVLISMQFAVLVILLRWMGSGLRLRSALREVARVFRKLLRPSSIPFLLYLFLLLPLTGFGFTSAFVQGIAIPQFISGELYKSPASAAVFTAFLIALALLNIRLAVTVPVFVLSDATGSRALRGSWRLTRSFRVAFPMVAVIAVLLLLASVVGGSLVFTTFIPTVVADVAFPGVSVYVAAFSLGIAQVLGLLLSSLVTALIAGIVVSVVMRHGDRLPEEVRLTDLEHVSALGPQVSKIEQDPARRPATQRFTAILSAALVLLAAVLGTTAISTMERLSEQPDTLVLAHRGFSEGGVENTISGLDAALDAGADLVERDVRQTKDGEFVAMHDAQLGRLADRPEAVKDLTLAELTEITVRDSFGNEDQIPKFTDYVAHADKIGMPLLIEIKLGGAETEDHVDLLVAELEELESLDNHIYHSIDAASVARLKELRPDLTVGYTMAFAGGGIPDTPADFIVVEEWSASDAMQTAAHDAGLGFMVWTVNDDAAIRDYLRRGSDGIITDHPDVATAARDEMGVESGLALVLLDALARFVKIV